MLCCPHGGNMHHTTTALPAYSGCVTASVELPTCSLFATMQSRLLIQTPVLDARASD